MARQRPVDAALPFRNRRGTGDPWACAGRRSLVVEPLTDPRGPTLQLRVATLNVWGLPWPLADEPSARVRAVGRELSRLDLDAIGFQEVWTPKARRLLIEAGSRAGLSHAWHPDSTLQGGLLILSRHPIQRASFEAFALRGYPERPLQGDYFGGKGYAHLSLRVGERNLSLIDTHLHARYPSTVAHEYRSHRTGQIVQTALALREIREPLIVLGDFNLREEAPEYAVLTGLSGLRDVAAELNHREDTVQAANLYRFGSMKPDRRIDYVFVRDGEQECLAPIEIQRRFAEPFLFDGNTAFHSDHAGLVAELDLDTGSPIRHGVAEETLQLASKLLGEGLEISLRRRQDRRNVVGAGVGCAALLAGVRQASRPVKRRRFLRALGRIGMLTALAPTLGYSLLSEVVIPEETRAFARLRAALMSFRSLR